MGKGTKFTEPLAQESDISLINKNIAIKYFILLLNLSQILEDGVIRVTDLSNFFLNPFEIVITFKEPNFITK